MSNSTPGGTHKYLELIYDEGYEVPRPPPQSPVTQREEEEVSSLDKLLPTPYSIADSITETTVANQDIHR